MSSLKGLPAFFQNTGKTVLDELTNFELGTGDDDDALLNSLGMAQLDDDAFGEDAFGDLKTDNLPSFFTAKSSNDTSLDILSGFSGFKVSYEEPIEQARPAPAAIYSQPLPQPSGPNVYHSAAPPGLGGNPGAARVMPPPPPGMTGATAAPPAEVKKSGGLPTPKLFSAAAVAGTAPAAPSTAQAQQQPKTKSGFPTPKPYSAAVSGASAAAAPSAAPTAPPALVPKADAAPAPAVVVAAPPAAPAVNPLQTVAPAANTFTAKTEHKRYKNMHPSDIRFIVGKVVQPLQTSDPFSDDFYFLQLSIKKNNKMREAALKAQQEAPPMIYVPLPTWKDTKERIKSQMDTTRRGFQQKSREWEEKEQVLGHQVRTDFTKPREVLSMPTLSELDLAGDMDDEEGGGLAGGEYKTPFTSRLWTIRAAVQRGFHALYTVQELHHLLSSPVVVSSPQATEEILREIDAAVALLSQAIGIRTSHIAGRNDFTLDGGHVGAILQTPKGKQLMSRSMKLLAPEHRWALLPVILARIFMNNNNATAASSATPSTSSKVSAAAAGAAASAAAIAAELNTENTKVEHKLLKTIIEFLQFSFQFQIQQQNMVPPGVAAEFTNVLLSNLRQCMKSVLVTQIEKSKLRTALMSDRIRAEVMHMIVQIGDKVSTVSDLRLREDWIQTREAFMSTLDS